MKIYIHDLADGLHEFTRETSSKDLELVNKEFYPNTIYLNIIVDKIQSLFRFKIGLKSKVKYICDRCLDEYESYFEEEIEQIYQIGHSELDVDDEIVIMPEGTREIDMGKALEDAFLLSRPIKLLCQPECKGLCSKCGKNLNLGKCDCIFDEIDPRLQKLKMFLK
jgi:uncharacterized protein